MTTPVRQQRQTLEDSGYRITETWPVTEVGYVVMVDGDGERSLWRQNPIAEGDVIMLDGIPFQMVIRGLPAHLFTSH